MATASGKLPGGTRASAGRTPKGAGPVPPSSLGPAVGTLKASEGCPPGHPPVRVPIDPDTGRAKAPPAGRYDSGTHHLSATGLRAPIATGRWERVLEGLDSFEEKDKR
jgi:hypothetical protein